MVGLRTRVWREVRVQLVGTGTPGACQVCFLHCWCCPEPQGHPCPRPHEGSRGQPEQVLKMATICIDLLCLNRGVESPSWGLRRPAVLPLPPCLGGIPKMPASEWGSSSGSLGSRGGAPRAPEDSWLVRGVLRGLKPCSPQAALPGGTFWYSLRVAVVPGGSANLGLPGRVGHCGPCAPFLLPGIWCLQGPGAGSASE